MIKLKENELVDLYLVYTNDYLTVNCFAEDHELDESEAWELIELGRKLHNERTRKYAYI